ncbi:MAG: hypothetical protein ACPGJS_06930 [Flammeovirgaceae bacterium]
MKFQKLSSNICLIGFLCVWCHVLKAQNIESPRFFHLNFQSFSPTERLVSKQGTVVSPNNEEPGFLLASKLLFPISLKGKTKLIGQLNYSRESIHGLYDAEAGQDKFLHFSNLGVSLITQHKYNRRTTYLSVWKFQTGSEQLFAFDRQSFSFNTTHLIQRTPNRRTKVGLGVQIAYNQRLSILPVIKYEKELGSNWKADILLPSQALFFKKLDKNRQVYMGVKGARANYLLNQTQPFEGDVYYRRLNANVLIGFERQLKGLLGFRLETGVNVPLRSGLYTVDQRWERMHSYQEGVNPYVKAGIFLAIDK